ncbi:MAG: sugar ABC transporter permease [Clostridiales bacterium]|nr:sugar ABC transporter permease [Clostridiales bacterium]
MNNKRKNLVYFFMILPAFVGFIVLFIVPTIMSFMYSVTNWSVYSQEITFIGLRNFQKLFSDVKTVAAIQHSVVYAILITIIQNALAIVLAVLLNKKTKGAKFVKAITFLPAVLSIMVVGYLFQYIMTSADGGLLNSIIQFFGGKPVNWLGNSHIALYSVLATQVWQWTGWSMVIYIANLKSIDDSLYEAADIDGATAIQKFFRVTLPLLYPATSFNVLMSLIGGMKMFDAVFVMTKGGPGYATETIMTTLIREGFNSGRTAYACAFAVVFFVVVFVFSKVVTFFLNKWEGAIQT